MKKLFCIVATAFALCACQEQPKLVILHVNDTHSHFEPERSGEYTGLGGSIERAAIVDSIRAKWGDEKVLLVHAGDFSQGTSYFSELGGSLEPQVINSFGYDVSTIGNHEFDNGIEDLTKRVKQLTKTKIVCSNIDLSQFELGEYIKPYVILERTGMKLGFIGLESNLAANVSATISSRIPQFDDVESVRKWASYLKDEEKCDKIILLSHAGFSKDKDIIPEVSDVDIVIGGHSHTFLDDFEYVKDATGKEIPIIQDGCWGLQMGEIKLW